MIDRICPQANAAWLQIAEVFLQGGDINRAARAIASNKTLPPVDPRTTEDCLFLDVMVPQKIYDTTCNNGTNGRGGAPVLVWIYGGGFTSGFKNEDITNPASLLAQSVDDGGTGVIFVAMNYRL
jgi:carboxylesterase type B